MPPESDLHAKAIALAERELQLRELNFWRQKRRAREDRDIARLYKVWEANTHYYRTPSFRAESIRTFLQHFCVEDLYAQMARALDRTDLSEPRQWKYFCACAGKIKEGRRDV